MNKTLKIAITFIMACCAIPVMAGAIHTWASGATLTSGDLNTTFQHIHNLMVGGHGARLVDADVNGSANIAYTKLALAGKIKDSDFSQTDAQIVRAWAVIASCTINGPCTVLASKNISGIARTGTGQYTVTLSYTATDGAYAVLATTTGSLKQCFAASSTTTTASVSCTSIEAVAASSGTVAANATATVISGSTCTCTDTTSNLSIKCVVSGTTLTPTGTGTDAIAYVCSQTAGIINADSAFSVAVLDDN